MPEMNKVTFSKLFSYGATVLKKINDRLLLLFSIAVCLVLFIGWRLSRHELMTSTYGTGYVLGPIGTVLVVLLMIYPLRKRMPGLKAIGSVKQWFQIHMFLGVVVPVLILFHSNFHLGALNSNVALFSLLIVSGSGVIGKYFYGRVHRSFYGERTSLIELQKSLEQQQEETGPQFALVPGIKEELDGFAQKVLTPTKELMHSIRRVCMVRWQAQHVQWKIQRMTGVFFEEHAKVHQWSPRRKHDMQVQMRRKVQLFLAQALKVAEFNFYERVFFLWHMLHLPLVFILSFAVLIHVLAVNRY
jgi:hypothetical protein